MRVTERGFTLVEALLAAGLSLALLTLLGSVLVPTLRASQRGSTQVNLQQMSLNVLDTLERDLRQSCWQGLALGPQALSLHRLAQVATDGSQVWEDHVVLYRWPDHQVLRELATPSASEFSTSTPYAVPALASLIGRETRVLAAQVEEFQVQLVPNSDEETRSIVTRVVLASPVAGRTEPERVAMSRRLHLRNQAL